MALENEDYKIIPQSAVMLFKPEEITLTRHVDCAQGVFSIDAFLGQIISGEVIYPSKCFYFKEILTVLLNVYLQ